MPVDVTALVLDDEAPHPTRNALGFQLAAGARCAVPSYFRGERLIAPQRRDVADGETASRLVLPVVQERSAL